MGCGCRGCAICHRFETKAKLYLLQSSPFKQTHTGADLHANIKTYGRVALRDCSARTITWTYCPSCTAVGRQHREDFIFTPVCILATPLKRSSFVCAAGGLLWPAWNYANTHFNLEQHGRSGATTWGGLLSSSAEDVHLIKLDQALSKKKKKRLLVTLSHPQSSFTSEQYCYCITSVTHKS